MTKFKKKSPYLKYENMKFRVLFRPHFFPGSGEGGKTGGGERLGGKVREGDMTPPVCTGS